VLITVGICTWNRALLLRKTLEQLTRINPLPDGVSWELIVVDNACTDATAEILDSFTSRLPLRRLYEPKPGLSNARNAALTAARGGHIVWTDDDVLVDEQWLAAYARAFARYPNAAFFGGSITAWFETPPPEWLSAVLPQVDIAFAIREFAVRDEEVIGPIIPFGANMAFRTEVLRRNGFDPRLGRVGAGMLSGEETALITDLLLQGESGRWVPGASVRHYIPPERQTVGYLRRYYIGSGASNVIASGPERRGRMLFGRPRWAWRAALQNEIAYRLHRLTSAPEIWIEDLKRASLAWGALKYRDHR
jgi:glucosyl-dolichyl phosphate glucuronosyltransferase